MTTRQRELDNQRTVIVAGAQGVSGRAVLERYATWVLRSNGAQNRLDLSFPRPVAKVENLAVAR
jgi:hypothetical protein